MSSLRWKIVGGALLLVFIPIFFLNQYALRFFDRFTRTEHEATLRHYAFMIGERARPLLELPTEARENEARRLSDALRRDAEEIGCRFQILDRTGRVLVDSGAEAEGGADRSGRPEVAEALRGGYSARARLTPDRKYMFYYVARPIKTADRQTVLGVAYVIHHTGPIIRALQRLLTNQRIATQVAVAVAAVAAGALAWTLTRRLRHLTEAVRHYAEGGTEVPVKVRGRDEVAELASAFRSLVAEMARRERGHRDAMAETAHEMRAPLAAIRGAAELLEGGAGEDPEARRRFLANILHEVERLTRLTRQLRKWTGIQPETVRRARRKVDYGAFLRDTVERLRAAQTKPCAELRLDLPSAPLWVAIAPELLEQVLANLIENAVRYTPPDGTITVGARPEGDRVVTFVEDTGQGIAPEDLPRVFDPYFTTVPKTDRQDYGSGMGLAIARAIVEAHRGRIWAESPGRRDPARADSGTAAPCVNRPFGARFSFSLPLLRRHI